MRPYKLFAILLRLFHQHIPSYTRIGLTSDVHSWIFSELVSWLWHQLNRCRVLIGNRTYVLMMSCYLHIEKPLGAYWWRCVWNIQGHAGQIPCRQYETQNQDRANTYIQIQLVVLSHENWAITLFHTVFYIPSLNTSLVWRPDSWSLRTVVYTMEGGVQQALCK